MSASKPRCVVRLDDSTSLRCPAVPDDCSFVVRAYATGEPYKRLEASELAERPAAALHALLADPGTPVVEDDDYGSELDIVLADGGSIRCPTEPIEGFWVRIVRDGEEVVYWDEDEFRDDPEVVLGALMGWAANAAEVERLDD